MSEAQTISILLALVATFFGLLVLVFGWMGNKVYSKLSEMAVSMHQIEIDLHGRITDLDRRVTRVEATVDSIKRVKP